MESFGVSGLWVPVCHTDLSSVRARGHSAGWGSDVRTEGRDAERLSELTLHQSRRRTAPLRVLHLPPGYQKRLQTCRGHTHTQRTSSPSSVCPYHFGSLYTDLCWQHSNGFINQFWANTWRVKRDTYSNTQLLSSAHCTLFVTTETTFPDCNIYICSL